MVRTFAAAGSPRRSAVQTVEVSKTVAKAEAAFGTTVGWYAGCRLGRLQVLNSYRVDNIGDEADVLMVKVWKKPVTTMSVAVARTGKVTTTTVGHDGRRLPAARAADHPVPRRLGRDALRPQRLLRLREAADLPRRTPAAVGRGARHPRGRGPAAGRPHRPQPWVGTEPGPPGSNPSATTCDRADFAKAGATRTRTRTYLIPQASLPARFGLSETYGVFRSTAAAGRFLSDVRGMVGRCEKRDLATKVSGTHTERRKSPQLDLSSWDLQTEVNDKQKVRFRLGFVRVGRTVAQLTFAPSPADDMTATSFHALLVRSGDRLRELG